MAVIECTDLVVAYNGVTALDGLSMTVEPGECHCLVGPNGSGKTTAFRAIAELDEPTAGCIDRPAAIGYGFQNPSCFDALTVAENLRVFGEMCDSRSEWVGRLREELRLDEVSDRPAGKLSGGYRKRLDLALALLAEPPLAALDEPLAELDAVSKRRLVSFLRSYCDEGGALLVATHRLDFFAPVADTVTVLDHGRVRGSIDQPGPDATETYRRILDAGDD